MLHRKLVDHGFATSVQTFAFPTRDPGLFTIYVSLAPGVEHGEVEKLLLETIIELKKSVDIKSTDRAKKILETEVAFARDGSFALASYINEAIAIGDWKFFIEFMGKIEKVTAKDVERVLGKYFVESQSTTGYYTSKNKNDN